MVSTNGEFAIETISLTKVFPDWWGRAKVIAVEDLNLQIRHNEIYGFLGPNGSGKTTTIKMLLNLLHPTQGAAFVLGGEWPRPEDHHADRLSARRILSVPLPDRPRDAAIFTAACSDCPSRVRKARIETLLEMVGLTGMANRQVGTFSKGMARRIGLAQALINDPDLLILDEPTSGMDPHRHPPDQGPLVELGKRGKTILLCSHLLADVEDVCDRIGILYGGRMQVEGPVRDLLQQSDKKQIITDAISETALHQIEAIVAAEQSECRVSSPMNRLEDLFVRVVSEAQQRQQRTSGAISTTAIGGFLAEEQKAEDILQRLAAIQTGCKASGIPQARVCRTDARPVRMRGLPQSSPTC